MQKQDLQLKFNIITVKSMQNINQTNFEDETHGPKIKTPASLFSKSSNKSPINRLRLQASPSLSQSSCSQNNHCQNHNNKQASFSTTIDGDKLFFCEKCAITLASQGHSIQKLQVQSIAMSSPAQSHNPVANSRMRPSFEKPSNRRQEQIGSFLSGLKQLRGTVNQTQQTIKDKLIQSEQFYGEQLQEVNDYFTLIIKSLELQKHKCYNHILNQRQQAEQNIRTINHELSTIDQKISIILTDIEGNLETVYSIEENMYKLVLEQYLAQNEHFSNSINGLLLTPIQMRKIEFEGVPESIYNLSDIVIQNSINNQDNQQYRLADSLTGDLNNIRAVSMKGSQHQNYPFQQLSNAQSLKFSFEAQRLREETMRQPHPHERGLFQRN